MRYRPEIDGLRAVSVLSVVLFHLGLPGVPGGFVGVDVFFVISGFLITSIIVGESDAGRFSLAAFYDRRIRRIFPAVLAMTWVTLAAGYWLLTPDDYAASASSAAYASASIGNIYFYRNTDYFDGPAALMPFLHTWSLAVEEQFYFVWPSLLAGLLAIGRRRRLVPVIGVAIIAVASFWLGAEQLRSQPKAAFYLPLGRAWELALGAGLALLPSMRVPRTVRECGGVIGLGLIVATVVRLQGSEPFPGINALPPTIGAVLILWLADEHTLVGRLLSLRPAVYVGKISYSFYLWHWPLIVLARHYLNGEPLPAGTATVVLVASIAISAASYQWIEQPLRRMRPLPSVSIGTGVGISAVTALIALAIVAADGLPGRLSPQMQALRDRDVMWAWECPARVKTSLGSDLCAVGAPWETATRRGIIWGDSHAEYYAPLLDVAGRDADVAFVLWRSCPAILREGGVERLLPEAPTYNTMCAEERAAALAFLASEPRLDVVVLPANWMYLPDVLYKGDPGVRSTEHGLALIGEALDELLPAVSRPGRTVMLFGDVPHVGYEPIPCVLSRDPSLWRQRCAIDTSVIPLSDYRTRQTATIDVLRARSARWGAVAMIPGDRMCSAAGCPTVLNGEFLYRDEHHLRRNLKPETFRALAAQLQLAELLRSTTPAARSSDTAAR